MKNNINTPYEDFATNLFSGVIAFCAALNKFVNEYDAEDNTEKAEYVAPETTVEDTPARFPNVEFTISKIGAQYKDHCTLNDGSNVDIDIKDVLDSKIFELRTNYPSAVNCKIYFIYPNNKFVATWFNKTDEFIIEDGDESFWYDETKRMFFPVDTEEKKVPEKSLEPEEYFPDLDYCNEKCCEKCYDECCDKEECTTEDAGEDYGCEEYTEVTENYEDGPEGEDENACPHKGDPFYPYSEACKDCPDVHKCFMTEDPLPDKDSHSATYDAEGNLINEEEIPSLGDYVAPIHTNDSEGVDKSYVPDEDENPKSCDAPCSQPTVCRTRSLAENLYNKLNKLHDEDKEYYKGIILEATETLLNDYHLYHAHANDDGEIDRVSFELETVRACASKQLPSSILSIYSMQEIAEMFKEKFGFKSVNIIVEKRPNGKQTVFCTLV